MLNKFLKIQVIILLGLLICGCGKEVIDNGNNPSPVPALVPSDGDYVKASFITHFQLGNHKAEIFYNILAFDSTLFIGKDGKHSKDKRIELLKLPLKIKISNGGYTFPDITKFGFYNNHFIYVRNKTGWQNVYVIVGTDNYNYKLYKKWNR